MIFILFLALPKDDKSHIQVDQVIHGIHQNIKTLMSSHVGNNTCDGSFCGDRQAKFNGHMNFDVNGVFHFKDQRFSASVHCDETDLSPYFKLAGIDNITGTVTGDIHAGGRIPHPEKIQAEADFRQIELVHPGGSYQGRTTVAPGMPVFRQNERVLLFLKRNPKTGRYHIVGLSQGKFEIRREEGTDREYLVPSVGKVDLVPALRGEAPTSQKAAPPAGKPAPSAEDSLGRQPRRYLEDVVGQVKAYKRLKSGVEQ